MKIREAITNSGLDRLDARVLMSHVLGYSQAKLIAHGEHELTGRDEEEFTRLVTRRRTGEPVAHLTGKKEFYGREFFVNPSTLIPRPDSETLIDAVKSEIPVDFNGRFIDIGVGTGALLLTLLAEFPNATGLGTDIVPAAIELAKKNATALGLTPRADFLTVPPFVIPVLDTGIQVKESDIIISNPPYIPTAKISSLQKDVKNFEPATALDGGEDGLDAYRLIATQTSATQKIFLEINDDQAEDVQAIFFRPAKLFKDLTGDPRVLYFA